MILFQSDIRGQTLYLINFLNFLLQFYSEDDFPSTSGKKWLVPRMEISRELNCNQNNNKKHVERYNIRHRPKIFYGNGII